jgi:hypothetical protein
LKVARRELLRLAVKYEHSHHSHGRSRGQNAGGLIGGPAVPQEVDRRLPGLSPTRRDIAAAGIIAAIGAQGEERLIERLQLRARNESEIDLVDLANCVRRSNPVGSISPFLYFGLFQPTGDPGGAEIAGMTIPEHGHIRIPVQTAQMAKSCPAVPRIAS